MDDNSKLFSEESDPIEPFSENGATTAPSPANGEPNTLPLVFCRLCQVDVQPVGKGKCPRCGAFLRLNFIARKGPINVLRRDQLHAENIAEYKPDTLQLSRACRRLANIDERLENAKEGTPEYQRLFSASNELTAILVEARAARAPEPTVITVRRIIVDPKIDDESALVSEAPTPEPVCDYCHCSLARCAEIKATRPEAWAALHWLDPEEVVRRDCEQADARQPKMSGEEKQQAEERRRLGWDVGVLNEATGLYRRRE